MADTTYMECKAFINYLGLGGGGFVENYKLPGDDYSVAKLAFGDILTARAYLLAYNWEIVHATVSKKTVTGDSSIPVGYTYTPQILDSMASPGDPETSLAEEAQCNDREASLMFRFDTLAGKVSNRLIRAVRDTWIVDNTFQLNVTTLSPSWAVVASAPEDTGVTVLTNYLKTVAYYTRYMNKVPGTNPQQYDPLDWGKVDFIRVATRDIGKGFSARKARRKARI